MSKIAFISTMYGETWGGSEQLWGAAAHALLKAGHRIAAGVNHWPGPRAEWDGLEAAGCELHIRESLPRRPGRILNRFLTERFKIKPLNATHEWLVKFQPDLVVVCQAWTDDGLEIMELCQSKGWQFATIVQAASEYRWPDDARVARLRKSYPAASAAFFVSQHNLRLTEMQIAAKIPRGEVVCNPFRAEVKSVIPWPEEESVFKLACVGRLQPDAKGQDILLQVLAQERWRNRPLGVTFFGKGTNRHHLEQLAKMLELQKVAFGGFVSGVGGIWKDHHALVLPSRQEGLPIVLLEANLNGRPAICNRTAGIPEIVEDGVTGFLSDAPTVDLFARAMERAWERRHDWREMGLRAAEKVRAVVPANPAATFAGRLLELASGKPKAL